MPNEEIEQFIRIAKQAGKLSRVLEFIGVSMMSTAASLAIWRGYIHLFH